MGMDDYVSKPVQLVNLEAILEKWLPVLPAKAPPAEPALPAPLTAETALTVDVNVLKALIGDDDALINEFLHDFRISVDSIGDQLRAACTTGQITVAGALAHKLKSSARAVGALALGELCAELEQAGKASDAESVALLLPRFEQERARVDTFLKQALALHVAAIGEFDTPAL
jgi:HPt (histidine-containing phosphotransfer) domain-containing protein